MANILANTFLAMMILQPCLFFAINGHTTTITTTTTTTEILKPKLSILKEKLSHLHFYFHDIVSGRDPTAIPVARPARPMPSAFGVVVIMDDLLTEGPEPTSRPVGRAQGFYSGAALDELAFLQAMNLVFIGGEYNGSVVTVLGRNAPFHELREMPVVGGSGLFRLARGYALARTHAVNLSTGDAVVEYNVYVMHY